MILRILAFQLSKMAATRYVALLRGINVSGQKIIKMEELKELFVQPGISDVSTYIQSGNVLFRSALADEIRLRNKIEAHLEKQLGYQVSVILRNHEQIKSAIASNPYPAEKLATGDELKVSLTFLQEAPQPHLIPTLPTQSGNDELQVVGRDVYILYVAYGNSKLTNALIEKKLGVRATTRNWATVNKIDELMAK